MTEQTLIDLDAARQLAAERQAANDAFEREHLQAFRNFHAGLANRRNIVYMFFTSNLLHWLSRALSFVPEGVNVVLIGSDLGEDEQEWVLRKVRHPFHHIGSRVDDNAVLELVFATAEHDFAWLHIDCFVLNPALFDEMMSFGDGVAMNCIWVHPGPVETMHSAFVAVRHSVLREIESKGIEAS